MRGAELSRRKKKKKRIKQQQVVENEYKALR